LVRMRAMMMIPPDDPVLTGLQVRESPGQRSGLAPAGVLL
jgi:hypothetical protein